MREVLRCDSLQDANDGCNVEVRYIFQVGRKASDARVFAQMLTAFEMASVDPRMVGLNLVQPEDDSAAMENFSSHMRMIKYLHSIYSRVHITLHAGELAPGLVPPEGLRSHIDDSVEIGRAERIGHGADVLHEDNADQLLQKMAERNIMVEICLTSNDVILNMKGDRHPLRKYIEKDVPVALATDDEGIARSDITREYLRAVDDHRLNYLQLKKMARTSLEYAFVSGASLWKSRKGFELTPQCLTDKPESESLSSNCQQFLQSSEKAKLQWRLEKAFVEFERQFP
jgi:adenosine deaminase